MNLKKAQNHLEALQKKLNGLEGRREKLGGDMASLQDRRAAAVRKLAGGDEAQRKTILALAKEAEPLTLEVEGLDGLITEAQEQVTQARAELAALEQKEAQETTAWVDQKQAESARALVAKAETLRQKIFGHYLAICELAGELHVNEVKLDVLMRRGLASLADQKAVAAVLESLPMKAGEAVRANGHRPLFSSGFFGQFGLWPVVEIPPELAAVFPGQGAINVRDLAGALVEQERRALALQYQKARD